MALLQAAKLASDVAAVGADTDLSGLHAVAADEEFLRSAGQQIRTHAEVSIVPFYCGLPVLHD
jgi:hypothetical protein